MASRWKLPAKRNPCKRAEVYLSLGSNMGDRLRNLTLGLQGIAALPGTSLCAVSSLYETEPLGLKEQPMFLNLVCKVTTSLPPRELLRLLQAIEDRLGRQRTQRWGPRTLDIDIVLYDRLTYSDADLTIPHPRYAERRFVLVPLAELAPSLRPPGAGGKKVLQLLADCRDSSVVQRTTQIGSMAIPWGEV